MAPLVIADPGADQDQLAELLATIANTQEIVVPVESLGTDPEAVWLALGAIERAGMVDRWPDHPDGASVVLSPLAASRLGLRPSQDGSRWLQPGEVERFGKASQLVDDLDDSAINEEPDPYPVGLDALVVVETFDHDIQRHRSAMMGAIEAGEERTRQMAALRRSETCAIRRIKLECPPKLRKAKLAEIEARYAAERAQRRSAVEPDRERVYFIAIPLPVPRRFLGTREQWPLLAGDPRQPHVWTPADGPCPACHGRPLATLVFCLWCDRSGVDHLIPPQPRPQTRPATKTSRATRKGRSARLKGGVG